MRQGVSARYGSGDQSTVLADGPSSAILAAGRVHSASPRRLADDRLVDESQTQQIDMHIVATQGVIKG